MWGRGGGWLGVGRGRWKFDAVGGRMERRLRFGGLKRAVLTTDWKHELRQMKSMVII